MSMEIDERKNDSVVEFPLSEIGRSESGNNISRKYTGRKLYFRKLLIAEIETTKRFISV